MSANTKNNTAQWKSERVNVQLLRMEVKQGVSDSGGFGMASHEEENIDIKKQLEFK